MRIKRLLVWPLAWWVHNRTKVWPYLWISVAATAVNWLILTGLIEELDCNKTLAFVPGFCVGGVMGYALNRQFTFTGGHHKAKDKLPKWMLIRTCQFAVSFGLFALMIATMPFMPYLLASALTGPPTGLVAFLASKWLFRPHAIEIIEEVPQEA